MSLRIVVAPDSFKESLSAAQAAHAIAEGVREALPDADIVLRPMADGGEGSVSAVLSALPGELRSTRVAGPLGDSVGADWAWIAGDRTAVIEVAAAIGLDLVDAARRDLMRADSRGVGELILAALDAGAQRLIIGLGGTATNDGGKGMLEALGMRFFDAHGERVADGAAGLLQLAAVDASALDPRLQQLELLIASDVDSPLCGPLGASHLFGAQKGGSEAQLALLDPALLRYAALCTAQSGIDERDAPGSGAAGGIGYALKTFAAGRFHSGVGLIAELVGLEACMHGAALVITGEGRLDRQTLRGKTPFGVAAIARRVGVPVIAIGGSLGEGYQELYAAGISAAFSIAPGPIDLPQAVAQAAPLLRQRSADLMRLWALGQR